MLSSCQVRAEAGENTVVAGEVLQLALANDGTVPWPAGCTLRLVGGPVALCPVLEVPAAAPGQTICVDLEAVSSQEGPVEVFYSLVTPDCQPFGEILHATVVPKAAPAPPPAPVVAVLASTMNGPAEALQGEVKTVEWTLANLGSVAWPDDVTAALVYNTPGFEHLPVSLDVPALAPGMTVHAGVSVLMPERAGLWRAMWAVTSATHPDFGEILLAEFAVSDFPFMEWMLAEETVTDEPAAEEEKAPAAKEALSAAIAMQQHTFLGAGEVEYADGEEPGDRKSLGKVSGVPAGAPWILELALTNDGAEAWPADAALTCCYGSGFGCARIDLAGDAVQSGETVLVQAELQAPEASGTSAWVLTSGQACIGPAMILDVVV